MTAASATVAFRGLYDEHHAFVWAVLRKLGVPERDAEDVMQEVFLVVHRRLDAFEGRSAWTTWLYGITTRVYWNYARRQRSRPQASASASSLRLVDPTADPERFTQRREASVMLEALLGSLDADKRTAYVLHTIEGLSAPQISAMTGVNTRTIYSRLRAAKAQIEASAQRVQARERNDDAVRRLAQESTAAPPPQLRHRGWAALALALPEMAAPVGTALAASTVAWIGAVGALAVAGALVVWNAAAPPPADPPARVSQSPPARAAIVAAPPVASTPQPSPPPAVAVAAAPVSAGLEATPAPAPAPPRRDRVVAAKDPTPPEAPALGLLPRARIQLKAGRAEDALALLRAHALAEPDSPLAGERTATMLRALCALGDVAGAKTMAEMDAVPLPASCVATP